jgi:MoCo/4Fe-4S cofactor protein with predicted Tat translocation signal
MKNDIAPQGKAYWHSLDQLEDTPAYRQFAEGEFPEGASEFVGSLSRRKFLTLMSASIAFAGLAGCRRPVEKIIPYVIQPEEIIPGVPQYYATTMPFGNTAYGLIVKSNEGRPTKIEGNAKHPSTNGTSNTLLQAAILNLYDPDRSRTVLQNGSEKDWASFVAFWRQAHAEDKTGAGLAILTEPFSSPTLARLIAEFRTRYPQAKVFTYTPVSDENIFEGLKLATGTAYQPVYHFEKAKVILSLDSDFLHTETENIRSAKGFADGRRVKTEKDEMNRLYVAESTYTMTGGMADHRLRVQSRLIGSFAATLAVELKSQGLAISGTDGLLANSTFDAKWIKAVAKELLAHKGQSLVVAGQRQPAEVHALVFAINAALANVGTTAVYHDLKDSATSSRTELAALIDQMQAGTVSALVMLGGNPVYNAPTDLNFSAALKKVQHTIHLSEYVDETSKQTEWHLPQANFLEAWSDARSADGTLSIVQPLIEPLFGGKSAVELITLLNDGVEKKGYEAVRKSWQDVLKSADFEKDWRRILHEGVLVGSASQGVSPALQPKPFSAEAFKADPATGANLEIVFQASPNVFDGRFANNGWLQELPDSATKLTWDNAAVMSNKTAKELAVKNGDMVTLKYQGRELAMPVWILPGQADYSISVALGYGHTASGRVGNGVGFNVYALQTSKTPHFDDGLTLAKTGRTYSLATTQDHSSMEGRPIVLEGTLEEYEKETDFIMEKQEELKTLLRNGVKIESIQNQTNVKDGYQWGMAIDLNVCTGCNACAVACQSENNIPVVGKDQVSRGREMHWIRIDRYFTGNPDKEDDVEMLHQPIACQHCENAPCEQVCPVAATVHDDQGLNVMVYNRCIGTKYCANNCPYKVRRFNFFNYTKDTPEIVKMAQNPDVTVRARGVMEKCTYCVQRITSAKFDAKGKAVPLHDGDVVSACQQACPTEAIVFGDVNNPMSKVSQMKKQTRDYQLLAELNVKPRTSFLAKLRNPNPELQTKA